MISLGYSNPTPWHTVREMEEPQLAERIEALMAEVHDASNCVFNLHAPSACLRAGRAPLLDADLTLKRALGQPEMGPVGSTAVRDAIDRWQPLLGLHGHIHEFGRHRPGRPHDVYQSRERLLRGHAVRGPCGAGGKGNCHLSATRG